MTVSPGAAGPDRDRLAQLQQLAREVLSFPPDAQPGAFQDAAIRFAEGILALSVGAGPAGRAPSEVPWRMTAAQLALAKQMRRHGEEITDALLGSSTPPGSAAAEEEQHLFGTASDLLIRGADALEFLAKDAGAPSSGGRAPDASSDAGARPAVRVAEDARTSGQPNPTELVGPRVPSAAASEPYRTGDGDRVARRIVSGLSADALARIACWHHEQPCGHPAKEHEDAVAALLAAGWEGGLALDGGAGADATLRAADGAELFAAVRGELDHAYLKHGRDPWGRHEFYAILQEEVDELWQAIKADAPQEEVLSELRQVAAMCFRYAETGDRYRGAHPAIPVRAALATRAGEPPKEEP